MATFNLISDDSCYYPAYENLHEDIRKIIVNTRMLSLLLADDVLILFSVCCKNTYKQIHICEVKQEWKLPFFYNQTYLAFYHCSQ